jgi:hypothetical protein
MTLTMFKDDDFGEQPNGDWTLRFVHPKEPATWVNARGLDGAGVSIEVFRAGLLVFARKRLVDCSFHHGLIVQSADFNQDMQPDSLISANYGGCGLAAGNCRLSFVLSEGTGYKVQAFDTLQLLTAEVDNVMIKGRAVLLCTDYYPGCTVGDTVSGNYPVHHRLTVNGAKIKHDCGAFPGYPRIVPYDNDEDRTPAYPPHSETQRRFLIERTSPAILR